MVKFIMCKVEEVDYSWIREYLEKYIMCKVEELDYG